MPSHDLTFGVFVPQGWKMELASIADPRDKWAKAVEVARSIAKNQGAEVVTHGRNGQIRAKDSYGNDPFPPKG